MPYYINGNICIRTISAVVIYVFYIFPVMIITVALLSLIGKENGDLNLPLFIVSATISLITYHKAFNFLFFRAICCLERKFKRKISISESPYSGSWGLWIDMSIFKIILLLIIWVVTNDKRTRLCTHRERVSLERRGVLRDDASLDFCPPMNAN